MSNEQIIPEGDGILVQYIGRGGPQLGPVTYRPNGGARSYVVATGDLVRMHPDDFARFKGLFVAVDEAALRAQQAPVVEPEQTEEPEQPKAKRARKPDEAS